MGILAESRSSYRELARVQKPGSGVPWYMREVNRRLGRALASVAAQLRLTPNQMTAASALAFVGGVALLVMLEPGVATAVASVLLLQLGFAFDAADGQLARLTGLGSSAGEWLDHVVDAARHLVFHLAVLIGLYRFTDVPDAALLLPLAFAVVVSVRFFAQILAEQLRGRQAGSEPAASSRLSSWIQAPADTGVINAVVLMWPWTSAFMAAYGALALANLVLLVATARRRHRELATPVAVLG